MLPGHSLKWLPVRDLGHCFCQLACIIFHSSVWGVTVSLCLLLARVLYTLLMRHASDNLWLCYFLYLARCLCKNSASHFDCCSCQNQQGQDCGDDQGVLQHPVVCVCVWPEKQFAIAITHKDALASHCTFSKSDHRVHTYVLALACSEVMSRLFVHGTHSDPHRHKQTS